MARMRKVDSDLMLSAGSRRDPQRSKQTLRTLEPAEDLVLRHGTSTIRANAVLYGNSTRFIFSQWGIDPIAIGSHVTMNNRRISFRDLSALPAAPPKSGCV